MAPFDLSDFLQDYFDALYTQDLSLFDRVFHPSSVLYSQQDGVTVVRPLAEYRSMVQGRAAPQAGGFARAEQVLLVDMLSPTMAVVKVRLHLFNNIMEDHLNLMKTDQGWRIFAKHFYRVGSVSA